MINLIENLYLNSIDSYELIRVYLLNMILIVRLDINSIKKFKRNVIK